MRVGDLFNVYGLTRRQEGSVKLGFAETLAAPEIGAFGNHIIQYFGGDAFYNDDPNYFFNYWYENLSLPEIYSYLRHLEQRRRLPRKLLIVQITAPNADNGNFILNWGNELPLDVVLHSYDGRASFDVFRIADYIKQVVDNYLHETFNYNTVASALFQGGYRNRVLPRGSCQPDVPLWMSPFPYGIRSLFDSCGALWAAYKRDGSITESNPGQTREAPVKDEDPLGSSDRGLKPGDAFEIARYLSVINDIGQRNGVKVVFIVPPVYESDRRDSIVNQIFNRSLKLVPSNITILDHRDLGSDPSLFQSTRHPSLKYYRMVATELARLGFIKLQPPS